MGAIGLKPGKSTNVLLEPSLTHSTSVSSSPITFPISLRDTKRHANGERFSGLVTLLPRLCPQSVLWGGGGGDGEDIPKILENGCLEHPGSAC